MNWYESKINNKKEYNKAILNLNKTNHYSHTRKKNNKILSFFWAHILKSWMTDGIHPGFYGIFWDSKKFHLGILFFLHLDFSMIWFLFPFASSVNHSDLNSVYSMNKSWLLRGCSQKKFGNLWPLINWSFLYFWLCAFHSKWFFLLDLLGCFC